MDMIFQDPGRGIFHPFFKKFRKPENALYVFLFPVHPYGLRKLGQDLPESGASVRKNSNPDLFHLVAARKGSGSHIHAGSAQSQLRKLPAVIKGITPDFL